MILWSEIYEIYVQSQSNLLQFSTIQNKSKPYEMFIRNDVDSQILVSEREMIVAYLLSTFPRE